jgi:molybdopterin-guanine dinucleotide biosynthesis protein A
LKIAGIVLAGGLSTRMGQDKANLQLEDKSLLNLAVLLLESINLDKIFVSGNYSHFDSIADIHTQLGPIGGLHACVEVLFEQYDALFILPVDMPLISAQQCQHLLTEFEKYPQGVFFEKVTFPMLLPLNLSLKNYLDEALNSTEKKHRSLYRLLKSLKIHSVSDINQQEFRFQNSNTPDEWKICQETYIKLQKN